MTFNNVIDVDKIVTNVKIKDAPYELDSRFLIEYLMQYEEAIEIKITKRVPLRAMKTFIRKKMVHTT